MGADLRQTRMDLGLRHAVMRLFGDDQPGQKLRPFRQRAQNMLDRAVGAAGRLLGDRCHAGAGAQHDRSGIRTDLATDQAQQRRFASTVRADKTKLLALGDGKCRTLEQRATLDAIDEIIDVQHARSHSMAESLCHEPAEALCCIATGASRSGGCRAAGKPL